jgi:hypothetical protein
MIAQVFALACIVALSGSAAAGPQESEAAKIVGRYLRMPQPEDDKLGQARLARLDTLAVLKGMPEETVDAIGHALPEAKNPQQRAELAEALGRHLQTKESAALLCELLKDPDDQVRWQVIHSLRMLARRTNRMGGTRIQRGSDFAPKVEGLVPYLVSAASDKAESNRICALYALADTRDPLAVLELRNRLKDPSEKVRLYAACFLTEYQDASGLSQMGDALVRLCRVDPSKSLDYYGQAEMLLASFERITGKSFGEIPLNPHLSSDTRQIPAIEKRYNTLLNAWAEWWTWEPKAGEESAP